jgi:hypothetical protein
MLRYYTRKIVGQKGSVQRSLKIRESSFPAQSDSELPACKDLKSPIESQQITPAFVARKSDQNSPNDDKSKNLSNIWYIDSGATSHLTGDINDFEPFTFQKTDNLGSVSYADGNSGQIIGKGTVTVGSITLKNVLLVKGLKSKLISLNCLLNEGRKVILTKHGGTFITNNNERKNIQSERKLFFFNESCFKVNTEETVIHESDTEKLLMLHKLLGHPSTKALKKLFPNLKGKLSFCNTCAKGKQKAKPYHKRSAENLPKAILQLLSSDLKGPLPDGWNYEHYIVTLLDEYCKYALIRLVRSKDQCTEAVKEMIAELESFAQLEAKSRLDFSSQVITFRSDGGGEYMASELQSWFKERGIVHQVTAPYSPSTNGAAERLNLTLMEKTICLLLDSNLSISLWPYAYQHAVLLYNITPHSSLGFKSPFEVFYGQKYTRFENLIPFGSYCVAHKGGELKPKAPFESTGFEAVYLGINPTNGLHICLNLENLLIIDSVRTLKASNEMVPLEKLTKLGIARGDTEYEKYKPGCENDPDYEVSDNECSDLENTEETLPTVPNKDNELPKGEPKSMRKAKLNAIVNIYDYQTAHFVSTNTDEPQTFEEAKDNQSWIKSMEDEIQSLEANKTWILVKRPADQKVLKTKWVYKVKRNLQGEIQRYKSRLVVQGYQQRFLVDFIDTFSSVLHRSSFRSFMSFAATKNLILRHIDIDTAFLNADMEENIDIYIEQPAGFIDNSKPDFVYKLKKSLYGIKQAPRMWQKELSKFVVENLKFRPTSDPCIFTKEGDYIAIYVDDIILGSCYESKIEELLNSFKSKYKCKDLGELENYIGFEVLKKNSMIALTQRSYIQKILGDFNMLDCNPSNTPFKNTLSNMLDWNEPSIAPYRSAIGALLYLSNGTRPDISWIVGQLARHVEDPTKEAWECVKQVFRYLKSTKDLALVYTNDKQRRAVYAYSDSDWGGDIKTRRSTTGSLIFHNSNLVHWTSKLQTCISLSSCEAEIIAMSQTAQDLLWMQNLITDLEDGKEPSPELDNLPILYGDNQSAQKVAKETRYTGKMKHLDIRNLFVQEKLQQRKLELEYCSSKENPSDILTKAIFSTPYFETLRSKLGLVDMKTFDNFSSELPSKKRKVQQVVPLFKKAKL